jgi:hypothetical protein
MDNLVGYEFLGANGRIHRVTGPSVTPQYMAVDILDDDGKVIAQTARATGLLAQHRALEQAEQLKIGGTND